MLTRHRAVENRDVAVLEASDDVLAPLQGKALTLHRRVEPHQGRQPQGDLLGAVIIIVRGPSFSFDALVSSSIVDSDEPLNTMCSGLVIIQVKTSHQPKVTRMPFLRTSALLTSIGDTPSGEVYFLGPVLGLSSSFFLRLSRQFA